MLDDVVTAIGTGVADLTAQIPAVLAIAIPVAVTFWAAPKLLGLLRRTAK